MADLCQNCGDCHLGSHPRPCPQELVECHVCHNLGHQYIFCPLSVKKVEPNFQYNMICHNCDQWHLPAPCSYDLNHCPRCGHNGHLPHFCPVSPIQRGQDPTQVNWINPELLRKIQLDTCIKTLRQVDHYSSEEILGQYSGPVLPPLQTAVAAAPNQPPQSLTIGNLQAANGQAANGQAANGQAHHGQNAAGDRSPTVVAYDNPFERQQVGPNNKPDDTNSSPNVPPTPNSPTRQQANPSVGVQNSEQEIQDGNATNAEPLQKKAGAKTKRKASAPKNKESKENKVTKPKAPRQNSQGGRCAECKKRHKKCEHGVQAAAIAHVSGTSQSPQPAQTPNDKAVAANEGEDQIGTPGPIEDTPSSNVQLPGFQSVQAATGAQTQRDPQGVAVPVITQEQQNALRLATAGASKDMQMQSDFGENGWMYNSPQHALDTLASAAQTQNANAMAPVMALPDQGGNMASFRPQNQSKNGDPFAHGGQYANQQDTNTLNFDQMMSQDQGFASSHHDSDGEVFTFDDNGRVVGSVEGEAGAETSQGSAAGRKPGEYLRPFV
ncbi:hypothetical protein PRZ48_014617 [Zasmidium cellare]|uniref:CCHC-type domain-containing protein n=1 Tax=Zasmidium cellare TaxID=395010 RepID=A0ABR0DYS3_ZASCE|nr:hypothetical protein PRZ48_014617 [Zasmidium cellare]